MLRSDDRLLYVVFWKRRVISCTASCDKTLYVTPQKLSRQLRSAWFIVTPLSSGMMTSPEPRLPQFSFDFRKPLAPMPSRSGPGARCRNQYARYPTPHDKLSIGLSPPTGVSSSMRRVKLLPLRRRSTGRCTSSVQNLVHIHQDQNQII